MNYIGSIDCIVILYGLAQLLLGFYMGWIACRWQAQRENRKGESP